MINNDLQTSGIYRAMLIDYNDVIKVYIPEIHTYLDIDINDTSSLELHKNILPTPIWNLPNLQAQQHEIPTHPCWVTFENGDMKRPVIMGWLGKGIMYHANAGSGSGSSSGGTYIPPTDISEFIKKVIDWAVTRAEDDSYGYSLGAKGPNNYDCSSFIWAAFHDNGLTDLPYATTSSMKSTYEKHGFKDVTDEITFSTGEGLQAGDILLSESNGHVDMYIGDGKRVGAHSSETGIYVDNYGWNQPGYNNKYDVVLRYVGDDDNVYITEDELPEGEWKLLGDDFKLTYYCIENYPHICNDGDARQTATGTTPTPGRTIAVDPSVIPYGSYVKINNHIYIAEDTGGGIKGHRIDIVMSTHQEALDKGTTLNAKVYIYEKK